MRKFSLAFGVVALVFVFGVSAIGQSQPYPVAGTEATLADAAKTNNFPLFDALYSQGGPEAAQYAELHAFWKWSMTDPVGGFYGDEVHARLAGEYPDYATYIADYGIVDANGRAFWPSAETRRFLLNHALDGTAPVIRVAEKENAKPAVARHTTPHAVTTVPAVVARDARRSTEAVRKSTDGAATAASGIVVGQTALRAATAVPPVTVAQTAPRPATAVPAAVVARPARRATAAKPVPAPVSDDRLARGFALIIAGILAVGMLTVLLRTPSETA